MAFTKSCDDGKYLTRSWIDS